MAENTVPTTQPKTPQTDGKLQTTREETRYQVPPVDIFETKDGLMVVADMPGVDREAIDVRVDEDILTIEGKTKPEAKGDGIYNEFALPNYFRQFQLNEAVARDKINAELKHGVLTIHLPKAEAAKPKQITVKVS